MKIAAVIFDLDGVICSTDQYHYQAWKAIADELHIPFDESVNMRLRGVSRAESFDIILEKYIGPPLTAEQKSSYILKKNQLYLQLLQNMSAHDTDGDVLHTLQNLRANGIKYAIASSSKNAKFILKRLELIDSFDAIIDGNDITRSKPDPEVFVLASKALNAKPQECLVVEDAQAGIEAAVTAGIPCAGIGDAVNHPNATYRIDSVSDILGIIMDP